MSTQFDFSVDFDGTLTPVSTGSHPRALQSSAQGDESLAHVDCHVKRFLHAIEVKGLKVCKDLQIMDGGELLIKGASDDVNSVDFTGAELVKEVELVFGTLAGGVFTAANPADKFITEIADNTASVADLVGDDSQYQAKTLPSTSAPSIADTDKWYLRLIKADGSSDYEEFTAVNHLLGDAGGAAGVSLLAKMQEVKTVQDALKAAFEARNVARRDRVDALENKIDLDFADLVAYLTHVETSLKQHSDDQNQLIHDYAMDRIAEMELSVQTASNDVRLHAQLEVTPVDTCPADTSSTFTALVGDDFADVEKWFIDVGIVKAGQRRADIGVQWEAQILQVVDEKRLVITASKEACDDDNAGISSEEGETLTYIVNGIWCGDQPTISENAGNVADPAVGDNAVDPSLGMDLNTGAAADAHNDPAGRKIDQYTGS